MIGQVALDITRYLAIVLGVSAAVASLGIGGRYARRALEVGWRQLWRDIQSLNLATLLPVHVAIVSVVMAGFLLGNAFELTLRLGEPLTWRLLYLPLNFLAVLSITLVGLFVRNKGQRIVAEGTTLRDRAEAAQQTAWDKQERRRSELDARRERQDLRDETQDWRAEQEEKRERVQDVREVEQNVREETQNERERDGFP